MKHQRTHGSIMRRVEKAALTRPHKPGEGNKEANPELLTHPSAECEALVCRLGPAQLNNARVSLSPKQGFQNLIPCHQVQVQKSLDTESRLP